MIHMYNMEYSHTKKGHTDAIDKVVRIDDNILSKEIVYFPLSKPRSPHT